MRILERIERHPDATFTEAELLRDAKEEFELFRDLGLIKLRDIGPGASHHYREDASYVVALDGDRVLGLQLGDNEPEIITLDASHVRLWMGDIPRLAAHLADVNSLHGRPVSLTDRLWFLGQSVEDVAVFLGLFSELQGFEDQLASLPTRLPEAYTSFLVVCPTFICSPTTLRQLETLGISVGNLSTENPFDLPAINAGGRTTPDFTFSAGYRSVTLRGITYKLSPQRAKLVMILHGAWKTGHPAMHWEQIKTQLRSGTDARYADRIQDVFKGFKHDWRELVKTIEPGVFALNL